MDQTQAIWIKDPLSIFADGAERGIVIRGGKIVELVPRGREPATANATLYDASDHVVFKVRQVAAHISRILETVARVGPKQQ